MISSATATGKTEAVVSPIAELVVINGPKERLVVVYVSPTRALVNDLYERLATKLEQLGLHTSVWTSDHHTFDPKNPSEFLLLTPESLDSAICRHPESFADVRYCILDELHLVDGTARGDQLAVLCKRLKHLSRAEIKFYALSATFQNPHQRAFNYFRPDEDITIPGSREIRYELFSAGQDSIQTVLRRLREMRLKKALFFCNSRRDTENLAPELKKEVPAECVFVHHGSLAKATRELAEESLRKLPFVFCVCTSTLEVGIDIGDVDAVVLVGCPPSVSSLLQRMGRGNRHGDYTLAYGLYNSSDERMMFEALFAKAENGELEEVSHRPCLSVAVQQTLSILFQKKNVGLQAADLREALNLFELTDTQVNDLVAHLHHEGYLEEMRGKLYPTRTLLDLADKGRMHSNISSGAVYKVVSASSRKEFGEIGYLDAHSQTLMLAGMRLRVTKVEGRTVYVEVVSYANPVAPQFPRRRNRGSFYDLLPPSLKLLSEC